MAREVCVGVIVYGLKPRRLLRITDYGFLCWRVQIWRQCISRQVCHLLFCKTYAPTEHCVRGYSIVAVIDNRSRQIGQLRFFRLQR